MGALVGAPFASAVGLVAWLVFGTVPNPNEAVFITSPLPYMSFVTQAAVVGAFVASVHQAGRMLESLWPPRPLELVAWFATETYLLAALVIGVVAVATTRSAHWASAVENAAVGLAFSALPLLGFGALWVLVMRRLEAALTRPH